MSSSGNAFSAIGDKERTQGVVTLLRVSLEHARRGYLDPTDAAS